MTRSATGITVRKSIKKDMLTYFNWANDPEVRNNSTNSSSISFDEHKKWFAAKLKNGNASLYIIEKNKKPLGQVRFDRNHNGVEIDYSVGKRYRGKGYGEIMLRNTLARYFQKFPKSKIIAKVKQSNIASNRVFEKIGFKKFKRSTISGIKYNNYSIDQRRMRQVRVAFYTDAGPSIGMGHLRRCQALADAFVSLGQKPVFIAPNAAAGRWVRLSGMPVVRQNRASRYDLLIVDSYRATARRLLRLKASCSILALIDDRGILDVACDWVFNSSPRVSARAYPRALWGKLLLGPRFTPLRADFRQRPMRRRDHGPIRNVLVTLGGGDSGSALRRVLPAVLKSLPGARVEVVLSPMMRRAGLPAVRNPRLTWRHCPDMRSLMESCDLAVSGGGQTLYELAFLGVPAVGIILAENQANNVLGLDEAGVLLSAGRIGTADFSATLTKALFRLGSSAALRARMSAAGRRLIDGQGALRAAKLLLDDPNLKQR